jgi:hypothetical protein
MKKILCIILLITSFATSAFAVVSITGTEGTPSEGQSFKIKGSGFGTTVSVSRIKYLKPALDAGTSGTYVTPASLGSPYSTYWNPSIDNGVSVLGLTYDGRNPHHGKNSMKLSWVNPYYASGMIFSLGTTFSNVLISGKYMTTDQYDTTSSTTGCAYQIKQHCVTNLASDSCGDQSGTETTWHGHLWWYSHNGGNTGWQNAGGAFYYYYLTNNSPYYASCNQDTNWLTMPKGVWIDQETYVQKSTTSTAEGAACQNSYNCTGDGLWYTNRMTVNDGLHQTGSQTGCGTQLTDSPLWGNVIFSSYHGNVQTYVDTINNPNATPCNTGNTRSLQEWWDDLYVSVDNGQAIVKICDSTTYSARKECQVFYPSSWSDTEIQGTFATGKFTSGQTAYLYVVNPDGTFNSDGQPVTIGGTTQYTLSVTNSGHGTVTSTPSGINCGVTCSASFDSGTAVTLTAAPDSGYGVAWSGDCDSTGHVTMSAAKTCTVTFTQLPVQYMPWVAPQL